MYLFGRLLANFNEIFIILTLSDLDIDIIIAHRNKQSRGTSEMPAERVRLPDRIFCFCMCGLVGVLSILNIVAFALGQHLYVTNGIENVRLGYDHSYVGLTYSDIQTGKTSRLLTFSMCVIILVVALAMIAKAAHTTSVVRTRGDKGIKMVCWL